MLQQPWSWTAQRNPNYEDEGFYPVGLLDPWPDGYTKRISPFSLRWRLMNIM